MQFQYCQNMKRFISLLCLSFLSLLLCVSCIHNQDKSIKKGSSGKTQELLLVADKSTYQGSTKALIDSLFCSPQPGLPQGTPRFDLVNIPVSSFKNSEMFRVHRNVLMCDINPGNPNKVYKHIDEWAAPQVVFDFAVKDSASLNELLVKYAPTILAEMQKAEHRRVIKAFRGMKGVEVVNQVKKQFGFSLMVSNEFELANPSNPSDNFAWIRKETKDFGIGVLVQVSPYLSQKQLDSSAVLDAIDTLMHRHVQGSADSSYMGLERKNLDIFCAPVDFEGSSFCMETRGCWRTFGDFMGGPMVAYTLLSPDKKQVVTLVGYVYCPRNTPPKRDLLMQVESICHSIEW